MNKYLLNFFQKPIDKPFSMWYNIITVREKQISKRKEMKNEGITVEIKVGKNRWLAWSF